MLLYKQTPVVSRLNAGASPPGFIAFVSVGNGNHWYHCRQPWLAVAPKDSRFQLKEAIPIGTVPRKPATALMSLPSVALSSVAVKQLYYVVIPS
jgi:hypothetical protein